MYKGIHSCHCGLPSMHEHEDLSQIGELKETRWEHPLPGFSLGYTGSTLAIQVFLLSRNKGEKQLSTILIKQEARQLHRKEQLKAGSFNVEIITCTGEIVPLLEKKKKGENTAEETRRPALNEDNS